jgi:hypothetical protein
MAAQVDFVDAGELLMFLDESQIAFLEDLMWEQGYLDRPQMARAFAAIRAEDGGYAVFVVVDGVARRRPVSVIDWPAARLIVTEGLAPGDRVILDATGISDGQAVRAGQP